MVYRALAEYLLHRAPPPWKPNPILILVPPLVFLLSSFWEPIRAFACVTAGLTILAMIAIGSAQNQRRRNWLSTRGRLEYEDWFQSLVEFAKRKQLEERSHPSLIGDLEACARLRRSILDALQSLEWKRLSKNPAWKEVQELCRESAEALFQDALWAAKGAFRPAGGRRATFERRCQDPDFAKAALAAVQMTRIGLERLLDDVSEDPFASRSSTDALARARADLQAIRDAEEEVRALVSGNGA